MPNELITMVPETTTGSNFIKACFNGTNAFLGFCILTIPYALASGGWMSLLFFFSGAMITFYTGILLMKCMDANPFCKTYLDIAEQAFGKKGRILVMIILNLELYLIAIGILIIEGDNLHKLFPKFIVKFGTILLDGTHSFIVITALIVLPSMLLTDLSILSYVSASGVFSCLIILCSTLFVGATGDVDFKARGKLLNINGVPTAISLYLNCFGGHSVIPSIYASMQQKHQFNKVLLVCFVLSTITYVSMAMVGYLMYGDSVQSQITLNLPTREVAAKVAIYSALLIPVTKYALIVTPIATAIEGGLLERHKNRRPMKLFIRIALLSSTTIVAFVFPHLENLMAIIGSIFVVLTSFVIPCLCYIKISGLYQNLSYKLTGIIGIIVFGTMAGILGTYSAISNLVIRK